MSTEDRNVLTIKGKHYLHWLNRYENDKFLKLNKFKYFKYFYIIVT